MLVSVILLGLVPAGDSPALLIVASPDTWPLLPANEMLRGALLSFSQPDKSYYHSCHFGRLLCQLHSGHIAITGAVLHQLQRANIVIVAVRAVALLEICPPADCVRL